MWECEEKISNFFYESFPYAFNSTGIWRSPEAHWHRIMDISTRTYWYFHINRDKHSSENAQCYHRQLSDIWLGYQAGQPQRKSWTNEAAICLFALHHSKPSSQRENYLQDNYCVFQPLKMPSEKPAKGLTTGRLCWLLFLCYFAWFQIASVQILNTYRRCPAYKSKYFKRLFKNKVLMKRG